MPARSIQRDDQRRTNRLAGSSRQALTALGTTTGEGAATADGLHTLAEAMAALAHEPARLIRAFHGSLSEFVRGAQRLTGAHSSAFGNLEVTAMNLSDGL